MPFFCFNMITCPRFYHPKQMCCFFYGPCYSIEAKPSFYKIPYIRREILTLLVFSWRIWSMFLLTLFRIQYVFIQKPLEGEGNRFDWVNTKVSLDRGCQIWSHHEDLYPLHPTRTTLSPPTQKFLCTSYTFPFLSS